MTHADAALADDALADDILSSHVVDSGGVSVFGWFFDATQTCTEV